MAFRDGGPSSRYIGPKLLVAFPEELLRGIREIGARDGYDSRAAFVRAAVKEKLERDGASRECAACKGYGRKASDTRVKCDACAGTGRA